MSRFNRTGDAEPEDPLYCAESAVLCFNVTEALFLVILIFLILPVHPFCSSLQFLLSLFSAIVTFSEQLLLNHGRQTSTITIVSRVLQCYCSCILFSIHAGRSIPI